MTQQATSSDTPWREATKSDPCPICEKPDWCALCGPTRAPEVVVCMRVESGNQRGNGGWLHRLRTPDSDTNPAHRRKSGILSSAPTSPKPKSSGPSFPTTTSALAHLESRLGSIADMWHYRNAEGAFVGGIVRFETSEGKTIRPISRNGAGLWTLKAMTTPRPLYRLYELLTEYRKEEPIYITEGEKCAEALRGIGLQATTSAGGSSGAKQTDWSPLAGRECILIADNDLPGHKYAEEVAQLLRELQPSSTTSLLTLTTLVSGEPLPEGGDVYDWIEAHGDAATPEVICDNLRHEPLTQISDPEEKQPLCQRFPQWEPFPCETLPEPLASFVRSAASSVQVDPVMIALPGLCAAAAAIGAARAITLAPDWQEPCVIWGALVAPSGEGKTPAAKTILAASRRRDAEVQQANEQRLDDYEQHCREYEIDRKAWEKLRSRGKTSAPPIKPPRPTLPRVTVGDVTIERLAEILVDSPRGVLMIRDELTGLLGGFDRYSGGKGGAERSCYLSMFNTENAQVDRKTGDRRSLTLQAPHLSIYGGIQPQLLHQVLSRGDLAAGLPARFLFAMPPAVPKQWGRVAVPTEQAAAVETLFERLHALGEHECKPTTGPTGEIPVLETTALPLTRAASKCFGEFFDSHHASRDELPPHARAAWPKLLSYAGRLALVLQLIDDVDATEVSLTNVQRAVQLVRWFASEALRVYEQREEGDEQRDDRELLETLKRRGGMLTTREIMRSLPQFKKAAETESALSRLANAGLGSWQVVRTEQKGRPKRVFCLDLAAVKAA
ncbi:DUF3987 domain-containing protein [Adhaeretor mobilis]|uniref:DUF3987 domain-containing protein n=1 Tax=Adhaeretor mobilis TaxID=1930276 RepID=A0A517MWT8_9BACT|nr:DUF3987 domain-containing protein [Adhaeretor mobilis]QDS99345.1 hypothetical protein HG15A2_26680 [Adhaeretor mobilis]